MKTYYDILQPIVLPYLESYQSDFTDHDKRELECYTGEFFYGIRKTGTDLFRIGLFEKALQDLINEQKTSFWTSRGLGEFLRGKFPATALSMQLTALLMETGRDYRFFIGKNGRIKELPYSEFKKALLKRLERTQAMIDQLKGSRFVYELELEIYNQEQKRRKETQGVY